MHKQLLYSGKNCFQESLYLLEYSGKPEHGITSNFTKLCLQSYVGALQTSVTAIEKKIKLVRGNGTHEKGARSGRPPVITESENKFIQVMRL